MTIWFFSRKDTSITFSFFELSKRPATHLFDWVIITSCLSKWLLWCLAFYIFMPLLFLIQGFSNISSWTQNEPKSACIFMKILPICPPVLIPANIILVQSLCRNHYFKMMCSTFIHFLLKLRFGEGYLKKYG